MKNYRFFVWISISLFLCSCKLAYLPTNVFTPQLQSKGDMEVGLNAGASGLGIDFAHAVTDKFGYMVNISGMSPFDINTLFESDYSFKPVNIFQENPSTNTELAESLFQIGIAPGCFVQINENYNWELFGGIGFSYDEVGTPDFEGGLYDSQSNMYLRYFIQSDFTLAFSKFSLNIANRITQVEYIVPKNSLNRQNSGIFTEPALSLKFGQKFKYYIQGGYSIPLNPNQFGFAYRPLILSLGIQFPISN